MKMIFLLGLFLITTMFSFGQTGKAATSPKGPEKKEQHVKVMINKNGKVTKIDTTFNFADEKMTQLKVDSLLKRLDVVDGKDGKANVIIMHRGGKNHMESHSLNNGPGEEMVTVMIQDDDTGKVKGQHKVLRINKDFGFTTTFDSEGGMLPPPPPPPPPMHVRGFKMIKDDPFAMDPNDQDIVTYDKKDIGKGLEKITIVRKKRVPESEEKNIEMKVTVSDDQKK